MDVGRFQSRRPLVVENILQDEVEAGMNVERTGTGGILWGLRGTLLNADLIFRCLKTGAWNVFCSTLTVQRLDCRCCLWPVPVHAPKFLSAFLVLQSVQFGPRAQLFLAKHFEAVELVLVEQVARSPIDTDATPHG